MFQAFYSLFSGDYGYCFFVFLWSHINSMSICGVPVFIRLSVWERERIMCKFVSFPKWAAITCARGMSMIFAIILLFITVFSQKWSKQWNISTVGCKDCLNNKLETWSKATHLCTLFFFFNHNYLQRIEINGWKTIQLYI